MRRIKIAIDGYSGCGKSSTAIALSKQLKYKYIDSGAMYRAVTYLILDRQVDVDQEEEVTVLIDKADLEFHQQADGACHLYGEDRDLEPVLRTMSVNKYVSEVSTRSFIRKKLVEMQQGFGKNGGIVMDGRDIGTVVFPDAELKIFLTAEVEVRARRRQLQLKEAGTDASLEEIIENFRKRDEIDSTRAVSPLRKADDAIEIDTSNLTFEEQVNQIVQLAKSAIHES